MLGSYANLICIVYVLGVTAADSNCCKVRNLVG